MLPRLPHRQDINLLPLASKKVGLLAPSWEVYTSQKGITNTETPEQSCLQLRPQCLLPLPAKQVPHIPSPMLRCQHRLQARVVQRATWMHSPSLVDVPQCKCLQTVHRLSENVPPKQDMPTWSIKRGGSPRKWWDAKVRDILCAIPPRDLLSGRPEADSLPIHRKSIFKGVL